MGSSASKNGLNGEGIAEKEEEEYDESQHVSEEQDSEEERFGGEEAVDDIENSSLLSLLCWRVFDSYFHPRHISLFLDPRAVASFRIAQAGVVIVQLLEFISDEGGYFLLDNGLCPRKNYVDRKHAAGRFSVYFMSGNPLFVQFLLAIHLLSAITALIGYHARKSWFVLWLMSTSLYIRLECTGPCGADNVMAMYQFMGLFLPLGQVWSVDAVFARWEWYIDRIGEVESLGKGTNCQRKIVQEKVQLGNLRESGAKSANKNASAETCVVKALTDLFSTTAEEFEENVNNRLKPLLQDRTYEAQSRYYQLNCLRDGFIRKSRSWIFFGQLAFQYWATGIVKFGKMWREGYALWDVLHLTHFISHQAYPFVTPIRNFFLRYPEWCVLLGTN